METWNSENIALRDEITWKYKNNAAFDEIVLNIQNFWNHTLISRLNDVNGSVLSEYDTISASYVLKDLLEKLIWLNKPTIEYRYDNEHSIYVNNTKLYVDDYDYDHQKDEEWIESQKNIFLNLKTKPTYIIYPEVWRSENNIRNYLNGKYTSGRVINVDDIIYCGVLINPNTNIGTILDFHIDELKSDEPIYEYDNLNNKNTGLHPYLKLKNNTIEIQFNDNEPYIVGKFSFIKDDITSSHPTSFKQYKSINFVLPALIDIPIYENVDNNMIYEVIGESLKKDFIEFLRQNH